MEWQGWFGLVWFGSGWVELGWVWLNQHPPETTHSLVFVGVRGVLVGLFGWPFRLAFPVGLFG